MDSDHRSHRQQIYSLPPLATWVHSRILCCAQNVLGAGGRIRTPDLLITNQLLYQLSYTSTKQLYYITIGFKLCQYLLEKFIKAFNL